MKASSKVPATDFKAHCLSLIDQVEEQGASITITRRGKPVAVLSAAPKDAWTSPENTWAAKAKILGDIVATDADIQWEAANA